jgi:AcrR family transcriptional regulator
VKKPSKMAQPLVYHFDKPAKDRIIEASDKVYRVFGIRVGLGAIAHKAHSNVETVTKYFGNGDRLVRRYVSSLIAECQQSWREIEGKYRNDPEVQLRCWMYLEQEKADDRFRPEVLLSRTAAELHVQHPLLTGIEQYWRTERLRLMQLCDAAGFKEPNDLGDKLLLLVQGARNERGAYGGSPPSRLLHQVGDDLMVAHGGSRKPLLTWESMGDWEALPKHG